MDLAQDYRKFVGTFSKLRYCFNDYALIVTLPRLWYSSPG